MKKIEDNLEKRKLVLGESINSNQERFELRWEGKVEAINLAERQPTGTLRPSREESVNWNATENLYIEGDNLEVLRILQQSYQQKINMIYIDPPYNTGKDFVYKDNFRRGRHHNEWLNFMYPRIKLARNLLTEDGVIVVHIDEHELHHLITILHELYGEENALGTIVWDKLNPKGDATTVAVQHESIVCFAKNKAAFLANGGMKRKKPNARKMLKKAERLFKKQGEKYIPTDLLKVAKKYKLPQHVVEVHTGYYDLKTINKEFAAWIKQEETLSPGEAAYSNIDEEGEVYQAVSMAWPNNRKAPDDYFVPLVHPVTKKECPVPAKGWRNPSQTMKKLMERNEIVFGKDETTQPRRKYLLKNYLMENIPSVIAYGGSDASFFKQIGLKFDHPKPYKFVSEILSFFTKKDDIILDFFSGSASVGHAVMHLNKEDGGARKFILVQLPEKIKPSFQSADLSLSTICDIGKERLRRVGELTREDAKSEGLDIGFKVFKLD
jgi:adenine-specific DNA-methyltransferase